MGQRQRLTVHPDCEHGGPAVGGQLQWEAGGEPVDGEPQDLVRSRLGPGTFQNPGQGHAGPDGVTDQGAAHLIRHAGECHRLLHEVHVQDFVVGEIVRLVDHAGDRELPVTRVDHGNGEGGVDPVEVRIRGEVRGEVFCWREPGLGGRRRGGGRLRAGGGSRDGGGRTGGCRGRRSRQHDAPACHLDGVVGEQGPTYTDERHRRHRHASRPFQEPAPVGVPDPGVVGGVGRGCAPSDRTGCEMQRTGCRTGCDGDDGPTPRWRCEGAA